MHRRGSLEQAEPPYLAAPARAQRLAYREQGCRGPRAWRLILWNGIRTVKRGVKTAPAGIRGIERITRVRERHNELWPGNAGNLVIDIVGANSEVLDRCQKITNLLEKAFVVEKVQRLGSPATALPAVAAIDIWKTTPFIALLLLAGLQLIPGDVYEAADVDGAGKIRTFFSITLPLLMPSILVAVIIRALDALRVFDLFYVLFGQRPDTTTMSIYVQEQIIYFGKVGYGSAVSVALLFIIAIFIAIYIMMSRWSVARS